MSGPDLFGHADPPGKDEIDWPALREFATSPKCAERVGAWRVAHELATAVRRVKVDGGQSDVIGSFVIASGGVFHHGERQALGLLSRLVAPPEGVEIPSAWFPTREAVADAARTAWRKAENAGIVFVHTARRKGAGDA